MIFNVGSKNSTKVDAVKSALSELSAFNGAVVTPFEVKTDEFGHPKNLGEIVAGAISRAKDSFKSCDYSVGIESGLMPVPESKTGFMEVAACAIFDGKRVHLGLSPAFEWPKEVFEGIYRKGLDGSQAFKAAGLTEHEKIGSTLGAINILSKGSLNRTDYNKWAVMMALLQLENPDIY